VPSGLDLTNALTTVTDTGSCLQQPAPLWISGVDIVAGGDILGALNQFAAPTVSPPPLVQLRDGMISYRAADGTHYSVTPRAVYQALAYATPGASVNGKGEIVLTAPNGRAVVTQPALQAVCDFKALTEKVAGYRTTVHIDTTGIVSFALSETRYMLFRPDFMSTPAPAELAADLHQVASGYGEQLPLFNHVFKENGVARQQFLYPSVKDLAQVLVAVPNAQMQPDGVLSFTVNGATYQVRPSYYVERVGPQIRTELYAISDVNGDGINDFEIVYQAGDKQVLYGL
jgi:hypothetical protein